MGVFSKWFRRSPAVAATAQETFPLSQSPADLFEQARALDQQDQKKEAIELLEANAYQEEMGVEPLLLLAQLYVDTGQIEQAAEVLYVVGDRYPGDRRPVRVLGQLSALVEDFATAETYFREYLTLFGADERVLLYLAQAMHRQDKFKEQCELLDEYLPQFPEISLNLQYQMALGLTFSGQYTRATEWLERLLDQHPQAEDQVATLYFTIYFYSGRMQEAKAVIDRGLIANSQSSDLRFGKALYHLMRHEFEAGWQNYAYRLNHDPINIRGLYLPRWNGQALAGKRIVVTQEQGLGDQIMFASCIPDLLALEPAAVFLEVNQRLGDLFQRSFPDVRVIPTKQTQDYEWVNALGDLDYCVQLGDLPRHFRNTVESFPVHQGYLRAAKQFPLHVSARSASLRVGIAWRGGLQATRSFARSLGVADLLPLLRIPGVCWVNLQFRAPVSNLEKIREIAGGDALITQENVGQDIDDLACLMETVDLVITACNTNVHLAGGLGKEVWVLTPRIPEWRYGMCNSMPWYPSARLFRQEADGAWDAVVSEVSACLLERVSAAERSAQLKLIKESL